MSEEKPTEVNPWTPNQHKFLDWLSLPATLREPLSQQMLAKELHVAEETLCRWKKLPGFEAEKQRRILARLGYESNEVMHAFIDQAKRGEFQHIKMYFEMMGWIGNEPAEQTVRLVIEYADQQPNNTSDAA